MRKEIGITLVALVVTVIVLLILAGVGIYFAVSNNGLIERTKQAVQKHNDALANEQSDLNSIEGLFDEYLDGNLQNVNMEDYKDITLSLRIEPSRLQKVSYLMTRVTIEAINAETGDILSTMTANVGSDWNFSVDDNSSDNFLKNTFSMSFETDREKPYSYWDLNAFRNIIIKGKVKKGLKYNVALYRKVSRVASTSAQPELQELKYGMITLETNETQKNSNWDNRYRADLNGDNNYTGTDVSIINTAFSTLAEKNMTYKDRRYIQLIDINGNPIEELKNYIGYDINSKGYISEEDVEIPSAISGLGWR